MSREEAFTLYQKGLAAIKQGDKHQARQYLIESVQLDARNEHAWLWLAGVAGNLKETEGCLRRVLALNPDNEWAKIGFQKTKEKLSEAPLHWDCPLDVDGSIEKMEMCSSCSAIFSFADPDALLNQCDFACPAVIEIAHRAQLEPPGEDDYDRNYALALIGLNLQEYDRAAVHLKALAQNPKVDSILAARIDQLLTRLNGRLKKDELDAAQPQVKGHVMLVDDSATVRKLITIVLEKENYGVVCASDGSEALTLLGDHHPDLILLDITMPNIDGYAVCRLIKSDEKTKNIPVVMLSGKDGFFDKVRGKMVGSTDHISKPFAPETLIEILGRYIKTPIA